MGKTVKVPPWVGGKQRLSGWVRSHLPFDPDGVYIEPFAGMLSVMCNRDPSEHEFAFDLDPDVVNFWLAIRDKPETTAEMYAAIAAWASKPNWAACVEHVKGSPAVADGNPARAAAWVSAVVNSFGCKLGHGWVGDAGGTALKTNPRLHRRFGPMSERVQGVVFRQADAADAVAAAPEGAVVYADPPYRKTHKAENYYNAGDFDHDGFDGACLVSAARVAVSGYPGDRDALALAGWRVEDKAHSVQLRKSAGVSPPKRVERMWFNYGEDGERIA